MQRQANSGGICSALLEVIEKLHDEEESLLEEPNKIKHEVKKNKNLASKISYFNRTPKTRKQINKKKSQSIKVKSLRKQVSGEFECGNDENKECKIETSVVNSLIDNDDFDDLNSEFKAEFDSTVATVKNKDSSLQRAKGNSRGKNTRVNLQSKRKQPMSCKKDRSKVNSKIMNKSEQANKQECVKVILDNQACSESSCKQMDTSKTI